jgi:hypothetical protein
VTALARLARLALPWLILFAPLLVLEWITLHVNCHPYGRDGAWRSAVSSSASVVMDHDHRSEMVAANMSHTHRDLAVLCALSRRSARRHVVSGVTPTEQPSRYPVLSSRAVLAVRDSPFRSGGLPHHHHRPPAR